jgi:glycosyltransferase involved in cell wall biosynthesis
MKVAFFANSDWFMYQFNMPMALHLKSKGIDIVLLGPKGLYVKKINESGVPYIEVPLKRSGFSVFNETNLIIWLFKVIRREKIDIIHNFTLRCAISGSLAAILSGNRMRINEITGLGYLYTSRSTAKIIFRTVVSMMLRISTIGQRSVLIVLNNRDYKKFKTSWMYRGVKIIKILGVGVDCKKYFSTHNSGQRKFRVLLPARMLKDKGVVEFVEAARYVKNLGLDIEFILAGNTDLHNPTAVSEKHLNEWHMMGVVNWKGHVDDMFKLYREVDIVVLPSHREGLPTSLTEAAACGLPLIATSVAGCEDVVDNNVNGFVIPVENPWAIAAAVISLYCNRPLCSILGANSRLIAENKFSSQVIFNQRMSLYVR